MSDRLPAGLINTFVAAWNEVDVDRLASVFAEDADFTAVNGLRVHGRALIRESHEELLRTIFKGTRLAVTILGVRFLRPGIAAVEAEFTYPNGILPGVERALANYIACETPAGTWEIVIFRNMVPFERPIAGRVERAIRDGATKCTVEG